MGEAQRGKGDFLTGLQDGQDLQDGGEGGVGKWLGEGNDHIGEDVHGETSFSKHAMNVCAFD